MARQDFELDDNDAETLLAESRGMKPRESVPEIRQYRSVYQTRLVLRVLSLAACVAILVVLFDSLGLYRKTRNVTNPFRAGSGSFPVWPEGLKLYPTHLLVGAAFVAGIFSFVLLLASFNQTVGVSGSPYEEITYYIKDQKIDYNGKRSDCCHFRDMSRSVDCCDCILRDLGHKRDELGPHVSWPSLYPAFSS